jgi:hypothetical protein
MPGMSSLERSQEPESRSQEDPRSCRAHPTPSSRLVVVLDKHIRIWRPDLANVGEFKANRKKRPKLEVPRCWRVPPGSWILAPDSFLDERELIANVTAGTRYVR